MTKINDAIIFATTAFDGQVRKGEGSPAIFHSLEAGAIAQTLTKDEDVVVAAVLHDTVEDAGIKIYEIEEKFGKRVAELVASETENKREGINPVDTWQVRKQEALEILTNAKDLGVKILFLSDKLSNMRSLYRLRLRLGKDMWKGFNQKDDAIQFWYYQSVAKALIELKDTVAYKEYLSLLEKTFRGGNNG